MEQLLKQQFLTRLKGNIQYQSVKELKDARDSPFSLPSQGTAVIAIVKGVTSHWVAVEKSTVKVVRLIDPTLEEGIDVTIWCPKGTAFMPGSILKIRNIVKSQRNSGIAHLKAENDHVTVIPIFKYDYEEDEPHNFFKVYQDRMICECLENWYTDIVTQTKLSDLMAVIEAEPDRNVWYVNLVAQPWRKRYMQCSMAMTFTDGTLPVVPIKDPYNEEYAGLVNGKCIDGDRLNKDLVDPQKFAHINIWSNEGHKSNPSHHFETAHMHDLSSDWWLLFLNVELKYEATNNEMELNLRSGHHQGKGVRTISKTSVPGRRLWHRWEPEPFTGDQIEEIV